jgi:hypothetical protein
VRNVSSSISYTDKPLETMAFTDLSISLLLVSTRIRGREQMGNSVTDAG